MTNPEKDDDLAHGFYRFDDLEAERIVHDRSDLHRKQRRYGFPQPVKLGDSAGEISEASGVALAEGAQGAFHRSRVNRRPR